MILVVDSGSTKTDWFAIASTGEVLFSTQTLGLNPQVLSSEILTERIINNFELSQNREAITHLYFYGAGCGIKSPQQRIIKVFEKIFVNAELSVKEDTYAAVYATVKKIPLQLYVFWVRVQTAPILMETKSSSVLFRWDTF